MQLGWENFCSAVSTLAVQVAESGFKPTLIVALARGGFIPGRLLSTYLGVKRLASISVGYSDASRTTLELLFTPTPLNAEENILLVEDCLESGRSLVFAKNLLQPHVASVKTCSVYQLLGTSANADFVVETLEEPPQFPWE